MTQESAAHMSTNPSQPSPFEPAVSRIWAELLQRAAVGPSDNFFSLGGDSMIAMMLLFRVGEELHVRLPSDAIVDAPTLSEFCNLIDRALIAERDKRGAGADGSIEGGVV